MLQCPFECPRIGPEEYLEMTTLGPIEAESTTLHVAPDVLENEIDREQIYPTVISEGRRKDHQLTVLQSFPPVSCLLDADSRRSVRLFYWLALPQDRHGLWVQDSTGDTGASERRPGIGLHQAWHRSRAHKAGE